MYAEIAVGHKTSVLLCNIANIITYFPFLPSGRLGGGRYFAVTVAAVPVVVTVGAI